MPVLLSYRNQSTDTANQLTSFYIRATQVFNGLSNSNLGNPRSYQVKCYAMEVSVRPACGNWKKLIMVLFCGTKQKHKRMSFLVLALIALSRVSVLTFSTKYFVRRTVDKNVTHAYHIILNKFLFASCCSSNCLISNCNSASVSNVSDDRSIRMTMLKENLVIRDKF